MLASRITVPAPSAPSREDIFSSALYSLFTDDTQNSHGSPGGSLIYTSPSFGDITLQIPAHPDVEEGRKLFAHYLWNASLVAAEGIERASVEKTHGGGANGQDGNGASEQWNSQWWNVRGKRVLELGAGTALPSIISALCNATSVTITDHPSSPALTTGAIQANVAHNLSMARTVAAVSTRGYVWGTETTYVVEAYGKVAGKLGRYDVIVLADCLWMPSQHANLVRTIGQSLDEGPHCCAIVVAGFHTGRGIVRDFFELATGGVGEEGVGGEAAANSTSAAEVESGQRLPKLKIEEICEINVDGHRRGWKSVRPGEGMEESKKWCVVAILGTTWTSRERDDRMSMKSTASSG